jgi:hypothetical protein
MRPSLTLCFTAGFLFAATDVLAQAKPGDFRYGADLIATGIDAVAAESAGVGDRAFGFLITGNLIAARVLSLNAEGGFIFMSDEAVFTQETTRGERSSGVGAGMGSLSAGIRTPQVWPGASRPFPLSAGVNAGTTWVHATRSIAECVDCHDEDVNVRAGRFWEPVVQVSMGRGALSARYRTYVGDSDFQSAVMIGYTTAVRPREGGPAPAPATSPSR